MNPTPKNPDLHIQSFLDRHAPMRARAGVRENYELHSLPARLGLDTETTAKLLEVGAVKPLGPAKSYRLHDIEAARPFYEFDGAELDRVRRTVLLSGLEVLAAKNPSLDSHDLAAVAENTFSFARRKTDRGQTVEFSEKDRARLSRAAQAGASIRFSATRLNDTLLFQAGAKMFGLQFDASIPLTGRVASDRLKKKLQDEDLDRRDANVLRAGVAGAVAGSLLPIRQIGVLKRAGIGAGLGAAGVIGIRRTTETTKDIYGDRSRGAKRAESLPAIAGAGVATGAAAMRVKRLLAAKGVAFSRAEKDIVFDALAEQTGYDVRREFGAAAYSDDDVVAFGIAGIAGTVEDLLQATGSFTKKKVLPAVQSAFQPGTATRAILSAGVKGAAVGGAAGAIQAGMDHDPNTHILPGILRGAGTGAVIGGVSGMVRGSMPFVDGDFQPSMQDLADKLKKQAARRGFTV